MAQHATPARPESARASAQVQHRLTWRYPRFRSWQYVASTAVTVFGLYLEFGIEGPFPDGAWDRGILFDDAVRSALVASSKQGRARAERWSDVFWYGPQYYPLLIDGLLVPLMTDHWNVDVAAQMTLINWQAQSLAATLTRLSHRSVGRGRPSLLECERDPSYDEACNPAEPDRTGSFISGHTSMSMTGSGLVCAHHQALPLYGGGAADTAACLISVAMSFANGVLRVVADAHWTSDVITGVLIGFGAGYGIPYFLHYSHGRPEPLGAGLLPKHMVLMPLASDHVLGLAAAGFF
jgi:hypothetical protein